MLQWFQNVFFHINWSFASKIIVLSRVCSNRVRWTDFYECKLIIFLAFLLLLLLLLWFIVIITLQRAPTLLNCRHILFRSKRFLGLGNKKRKKKKNEKNGRESSANCRNIRWIERAGSDGPYTFSLFFLPFLFFFSPRAVHFIRRVFGAWKCLANNGGTGDKTI